MKKLTLFALASFLLFNYGNSQTVKSLSVSGGYSLANQNVEIFGTRDIINEKPIGGWGIDVGLGFWQNNNFVFSTHIGFIKKGLEFPLNSIDSNGVRTETNSRIRLNYVYIAPRISFKKELKYFTPFIFIAPRVDFRVSTNYQFFYNGNQVYDSKDNPNDNFIEFYKDNHKPIILGSTLGMGLEKKIFDNVAVGIEVAYWLDITRAVDFTNPIEEGKQPSGQKSSNKAFTAFASIKYLFNKG